MSANKTHMYLRSKQNLWAANQPSSTIKTDLSTQTNQNMHNPTHTKCTYFPLIDFSRAAVCCSTVLDDLVGIPLSSFSCSNKRLCNRRISGCIATREGQFLKVYRFVYLASHLLRHINPSNDLRTHVQLLLDVHNRINLWESDLEA